MDTEAETVATETPARPLNCVEAEVAAGAAAAEDSCAARGSLQPAPAQPPGDPAAQASVSNGEDAGGGAGQELVDLKIIWNKTKHDVKFPLDSTGSELKQKIHSITGNRRGTVSDSQPSSPRLLIPSACTMLSTGLATLFASAPSMLRIVLRSKY